MAAAPDGRLWVSSYLRVLQICRRQSNTALRAAPHATHFLQPLDVGCFQPLKWYHGRVLDYAARAGARDINKADFMAAIDDVRRQAFRASTIMSGWRSTGLHPFEPERVLCRLRAQETANDSTVVSCTAQQSTKALTPTLCSSDIEDSDGQPVLRTPERSSRQLRESLFAASQDPSTITAGILTPGDIGWQTPRGVKELDL